MMHNYTALPSISADTSWADLCAMNADPARWFLRAHTGLHFVGRYADAIYALRKLEPFVDMRTERTSVSRKARRRLKAAIMKALTGVVLLRCYAGRP